METSVREETTEIAREQYDRAYRLAKGKKPEEAIPLFLEIVRWDRGSLAKKVRREAHQKVLWCLSQVRNWTELDDLARLALHRYPESGWGHRFLGEAQYRLGKMKKAIASLEKAIELDPDDTDARVVLEAVRRRSETRRARVRGWPARQNAFAKPRELIEQYVLRDQPGEPFIRKDTVFMTLGSCFAENLARRLRDAGYTVNSEEIGEEINSTYANRHLLEWIEKGPVNPVTKQMEAFYGPGLRERLKRYIEDSEVFVLTLGLAPCFFEPENGRFVFLPPRTEQGRTLLHANHVMRTTTVSENVRNLELVLEGLRRMARRPPTIVMTVSPVPLSGTSELHSAVVADCVSKSTLRVACHEVMTLQDSPGLIYWPSFEMVRWLGTHFGPDQPHVYGADDANTRHVSNWLVKLIIDLFVERYAVKDAAKASA
jgi:tetratricopeptide (TPR) repeat protein